MQFKFKDEKVKKILCNHDKLQRKVGIEIGKKIKQRMNQLEAAETFYQYITKIPFGKPHQLKGELDNCFGISITSNYRMVVEPLETRIRHRKLEML